MAYQDIGIRVLILGVGEARRSISSVQNDVKSLENTISNLSGSSATFGKAISSVGSALTSFGRTLTLMVTTPLLALDAALITSGINFEDAFTGVTKTIDGVAMGFDEILAKQLSVDNAFKQKLGEDWGIDLIGNLDSIKAGMTDAEKAAVFADPAFGSLTEKGIELRNAFRNLALELPVSAVELAKIAQLGGQFKVPADQIVEFTKVMAELGMATNLTGEEAATAIAQFANIFGIESENLTEYAQSFGAALVALGNTTATTEADIMAMSTRLAASGQIAGLSETQILGLTAALSSMGTKSEMGGSALARIFQELYMAVAQGGDALTDFTAVTGQSAEEFQKAFGADPIAQMLLFTSSLADMQDAGDVNKDMLIALGLSGIRVSTVWMELAQNTGLVTDAVNTAQVAWEEQIALQEEAQKRMFTVKGQIQLLKNGFVDLGITLFDLYRQDIVNIITGFRDLLNQIKKLDPRVQKTIFNFSLLAAAAGPLLIVLGTIIQNVGVLVTAFQAVPGMILKVISVFGSLVLSLAPVIAIAGAVYLAYEKNFLGLKDLVDSTFGSIVKTFKEFKVGDILKDTLGDALKGDFGGVTDNLKSLLDITLGWFSGTFKPNLEQWFNENGIFQSFSDSLEKSATVGGLEKVFGQWFDAIKKILANRITDLGESFKIFGSGVGGFFENLKGIRLEGFARALGVLTAALLDFGMAVSSKGLTMLGTILPPIGAALKDFVSALSDLLMGDYQRALKTFIEGFMHVGEVGTKLKDQLGLQPVIDKVVKAVNSIRKAFEEFKSSKVGELLQTYIVKPFLELGDLLAPLGASFMTFWNTLKSADWSFLGVFWSYIKQIGEVLIQVWGGVLVIVVNAFIELIRGAINIISTILPTIGDVFAGVANTISNLVKGNIGDAFLSFIETIKNVYLVVYQIGYGIGETFRNIATNIVNFVSEATVLDTWILAVWQKIKSFIDNALVSFGTFVTGVWDKLKEFATVLNETLVLPVSAAVTKVWNFFFGPSNSVWATITGFATNVVNWFEGMDLKTTFEDAFRTTVDLIKSWFSFGDYGSMGNSFRAFVNSMPIFFSNLPGNLKTFITDVFEFVKDTIGDFFSWFAETGIGTKILSWMNAIPEKLAGLGNFLKTNLLQPFIDVINSIKDTFFGGGEGSLKTILSKLGSSILGWLSDIAGVGAEIGAGFVGAFMKAFSAIEIKIIDALNDAIPNSFDVDLGPLGKQTIDLPDNPIPKGSKDTGGLGLPGHAYTINPQAAPEVFIPGVKGNFYPNFDRTILSALMGSLSQIVSPMMSDNRQYSPVYSPNFNSTPNQEMLDANGSLYDQWITSQQGMLK